MLRKPEFVSVMAVCFPRCVRIFGYGFSKVRAVHERRGNADFKRRGGRWGTVWYVGALGKNIRKITEYTRSRLKEDAMSIQLIISLVPLYGESGSLRPVVPRAASLVPFPLYGEPGSLRPVAPRAASLVPLLLYGEPGSLRPVRPFKAFADTVSFISVYEGLPVGPQIFCGGKIPGRAGGFLFTHTENPGTESLRLQRNKMPLSEYNSSQLQK